jgi:hypothetical protein
MASVANAAGVNYSGGKFATGINDKAVLYFATSTAGVNDTGSKFATSKRYRWQIMETISDRLHIKVNLKKKIYLYVKKFESALMEYLGAWGKLIHEKT